MSSTSLTESLQRRLFSAATSGNTKAISRILAEIPNISVERPLMAAAGNGHAAAVRIFLSKPRSSSADGSALSQATSEGHAECVAALLEAMPKSASCVALCLVEAAKNGDAACSRLLLAKNKNRAALADALTWAVVSDHVGTVELLVDEGNASVADGGAIECAAAKGSVKSLRIMLPLWTRPTARSRWLQAAAYGGHTECLAILLDSFALLSAARMRELASFSRTGGHPQTTESIESRIELLSLDKHVVKKATCPAKPRL